MPARTDKGFNSRPKTHESFDKYRYGLVGGGVQSSAAHFPWFSPPCVPVSVISASDFLVFFPPSANLSVSVFLPSSVSSCFLHLALCESGPDWPGSPLCFLIFFSMSVTVKQKIAALGVSLLGCAHGDGRRRC